MYGLRFRALFVALFAAWLPFAGLAQTESLQLMDRIVAIVEDDVILHSELRTRVHLVTQQFLASGGQLPPADVVERQVLETLVLERLQLQRAEQTGIRVSDEEVNETIEAIAQQNGMTQEQLKEALAADGFDFDAYRKNLRGEMTTQRLRQRLVSSQVQVTDNEIDLLLAKQASQGSATVRLGHILVSVPQNATPDEIRETEEEAKAIYQQILEGLSFAEAAITHSDDQYALNGGDLGWRPVDQVPTLFSSEVQRMSAGEVLAPVRSPAGWHIVKVLETRAEAAMMVGQVLTRHILIRPSELVTEKQAEDTIRDIYARVVSGEDFAALAQEYSDDTFSAPDGGSLGWAEPAAYGDAISKTLNTMQPGQVAPPFRTTAGWHIFRLDDRRQVDKGEEVRRNQARDTIFARKAEEAYELWLRRVRDEAYVELRVNT